MNRQSIHLNAVLWIGAMLLAIMGLITGPAFALQTEWEKMLSDVHGPIAVDPVDSDVIYVAVRGATSKSYTSGMLKSTDGGKTWEHYSEGWGMGTAEDILINPHNTEEILVTGGPFVAVLWSTDGGQTWMNASSGIPQSSHGYGGRKLAYDTRDSTWFVANASGGFDGGVYRSKNESNWQLILDDSGITTMMIDEEHDVMYAGNNTNSIMRSFDGGQNWEVIQIGMDISARHLARVPGSKTIYAATRQGIYKSYDMAETWIDVNDTLTSQFRFTGGIVVSENDTNTVIAGGMDRTTHKYRVGIFKSTDNGNTWQREIGGIPDSNFVNHHLFLDQRINALYSNMWVGSGPNIYKKIVNAETNISDFNDEKVNLPESIELYQNYPNPFNPVTIIEYALPHYSAVQLQVYDMTGRLIETLVDRGMSPGRHQAVWDASNAASGMYIYRLRAGEMVQSRKMLLLR